MSEHTGHDVSLIDGSSDELSHAAIMMWICHFPTPGSTLRFGGDGAVMEITPMARTALDELIAHGAVEVIPADDSVPNREHYGATSIPIRDAITGRYTPDEISAMMFGTEAEEFVTFTKADE